MLPLNDVLSNLCSLCTWIKELSLISLSLSLSLAALMLRSRSQEQMGPQYLLSPPHIPLSPTLPLGPLPHPALSLTYNTPLYIPSTALEPSDRTCSRTSMHRQRRRTGIQHLLSQTRRCVVFPSRPWSDITHDGGPSILHDGRTTHLGHNIKLRSGHLGFHLCLHTDPIPRFRR